MTIEYAIKAEENFPISGQGYTNGKLLDQTECTILIDTGASKSYMSKSYYMRCKSLHAIYLMEYILRLCRHHCKHFPFINLTVSYRKYLIRYKVEDFMSLIDPADWPLEQMSSVLRPLIQIKSSNIYIYKWKCRYTTWHMHSVITEEHRSQMDTQQNKYKEEEDTIKTTQQSTEESQVK